MKDITAQETKYRNVLLNAIQEYQKELKIQGSIDNSGMVRLTNQNLQLVVTQSTHLVKSFVEEHLYPLMWETKKNNFWQNYNLEENDWQNLGKKILCEIFSDRFTVPLEKEDVDFCLDVKHVNIEEYFKMLKDNHLRDDLDKADIITAPQINIRSQVDFLYRSAPVADFIGKLLLSVDIREFDPDEKKLI